MSTTLGFPSSYMPSANYRTEEFFGRESDFNKVLDLALSGQNVNLTGLRQIGRTWFLQCLADIAPTDSRTAEKILIPEKLDAAQLRGLSSPFAVATAILHKMQVSMHRAGWIGNTLAKFGENSWDGFFDAFEFIAPILRHHQRIMVLLLDETEAIADIYRSVDDGESEHSSLPNLTMAHYGGAFALG